MQLLLQKKEKQKRQEMAVKPAALLPYGSPALALCETVKIILIIKTTGVMEDTGKNRRIPMSFMDVILKTILLSWNELREKSEKLPSVAKSLIRTAGCSEAEKPLLFSTLQTLLIPLQSRYLQMKIPWRI